MTKGKTLPRIGKHPVRVYVLSEGNSTNRIVLTFQTHFPANRLGTIASGWVNPIRGDS